VSILEDNLIFITEAQRETLKDAYLLIESIKSQIDWDCEEYSAIDTSLQDLKNAIYYKKKFF